MSGCGLDKDEEKEMDWPHRGAQGSTEWRTTQQRVREKQRAKEKRFFSPSHGVNADISGHKSDNYNGIKLHEACWIDGRPHAFTTESSPGRVHHCPHFQSRLIPNFMFSRGEFTGTSIIVKSSPDHPIVDFAISEI